MSENKGHAFKLFGRTIPLKPTGDPPPLMPPCGGCSGEDEKDVPNKESVSMSNDRSGETPESQEKNELPKSMPSDISEVPSYDKEGAASMAKQTSEEQQDDEPSNSKGKALKKPDKVLPCPRCNSMNTKFCYYNNYNVNQPRHFCKNCQRYWTSGGTMRNVPVGSGRRKNNNSNHFHRLMAHPPPHAVRTNASDVIAYPPSPNGTVLHFGSDTPVCASALNFEEKNIKSSDRNGFHHMEEKMVPPPLPPENSSPNSKGMTTSSSGKETATQAPLAAPCFSGSPLPYTWIPAPLCGPSFPVPFFPAAAYWNCTVAPVTWSTPLVSPVATIPVSTHSQSAGSSSSLGKHTREGDVLASSNTPMAEASNQTDNQERGSILIPKTLRIHDPEEAAKSSIWSLIGARNSKADAISGGGLFKAFQPKDTENHVRDTSAILHANPAALSRSLNFQESS